MRTRFAGTVAVVAGLLTVALLMLGVGAGAAQAKTVWLCKPGMADDPCTPGLSTTVYSPTLQKLRVTHPRAAEHPSFDCFYVYPTVSDETTTLSDRVVHPEERSIALYQTARYSQSCRVYAPMYRQVTVPTLFKTGSETAAQLKTGLGDVTTAFKTYLRRYSDGRPFVLIGHSQGSFVLKSMIHSVIDPDPALRHRLLSAILLGGNVTVKDGEDVGGTFSHIPACAHATSLSCVVAYSSFDAPVPTPSLFGRTTAPGQHVLCVNPAALTGGSAAGAKVDAILPSAPFAPGTLIATGNAGLKITQPQPSTVWSSLPDSYTATCSSADGAHVLQFTAHGGAQTPSPSPSAEWGLHLLDANDELGNLLTFVDDQAAQYAKLSSRTSGGVR